MTMLTFVPLRHIPVRDLNRLKDAFVNYARKYHPLMVPFIEMHRFHELYPAPAKLYAVRRGRVYVGFVVFAPSDKIFMEGMQQWEVHLICPHRLMYQKQAQLDFMRLCSQVLDALPTTHLMTLVRHDNTLTLNAAKVFGFHEEDSIKLAGVHYAVLRYQVHQGVMR